MKKIVSIILAFVMLFSLCACSGESALTPEQVDKKVKSGELGTIQAFYSVRNDEDGTGDFYVQFNSALETVFDFYSADGTLVEFYGDPVVYDAQGNVVPRSEIKYGQGVTIVFNGEAEDTNPPTIKAYKVTLS